MSPIDRRQLVIIAALEGLVVMSAVARVVLGFADLAQLAHILWLAVVLLVAGGAIAQYVLRATMLAARAREGEDVLEQRRSVLVTSLLVLVLAGALSAIGPGFFARLLG